MYMLEKLSKFWNNLQYNLFPALEEELPPLLESHRRVIPILEIIKIEEFVTCLERWRGRPAISRKAIARAFIVKSVLKLPTNVQLRDRLLWDKALRMICGWEHTKQVPSVSVLSRAFAEFSESQLPAIAHKTIIQEVFKGEIVGHLSRDSSDIPAREKSKRKKVKHVEKRGGPRSKGPGKCEVQLNQTLPEMLSDISMECDFGSKTSSKGHRYNWIGFKLHADVTDNGIPISCILTSASVADPLMAIPLSMTSGQRVTSLYELMDKAYYVNAITEFVESQGRKACIIECPKNPEAKEEKEKEEKAREVLNWQPAEATRLENRTVVERFFSDLKDNYGGRMIRVRGNSKVSCHLMFGVLGLTGMQLLRLIC